MKGKIYLKQQILNDSFEVNSTSETFELQHGVPRGSYLGPIAFGIHQHSL